MLETIEPGRRGRDIRSGQALCFDGLLKPSWISLRLRVRESVEIPGTVRGASATWASIRRLSI